MQKKTPPGMHEENRKRKIAYIDGFKQLGRNFGFPIILKNETVRGTFCYNKSTSIYNKNEFH